MKSIRYFMASKIRRSEVQHLVQLITDGETDPVLGKFEGRLDTDEVEFFARGIRFSGTQVLEYTDIFRVERSPEEHGERCLDIVRQGGEVARLRCTNHGGMIIHATLRWVGHTKLGRYLAD